MFRAIITPLAVALVLAATVPAVGGVAGDDAAPSTDDLASPGDSPGPPGGDGQSNGTLTLNATRVPFDGSIRFTVTATRGPVQFFRKPPYRIQQRVRGEWIDLPGASAPILPEPIERGASRSWTWSPRRLSEPVRPGQYRVVFDGRSGDLAARFRAAGDRPRIGIRPADAVIARNETTTLEVVARTASTPAIAAVDVSLVLANATAATAVGASGAAGATATVAAAADGAGPNGSRVRIAAGNVTGGDGPVTLATVRVRGHRPGRTDVAVRPREVVGADGRPYGRLHTDDAAVEVVASGSLDVTGEGPATDPDGDGHREDLTADGSFDVLDVAAFLGAFDRVGPRVAPAFDFDGDGDVDVVDVAALLAEA